MCIFVISIQEKRWARDRSGQEAFLGQMSQKPRGGLKARRASGSDFLSYFFFLLKNINCDKYTQHELSNHFQHTVK